MDEVTINQIDAINEEATVDPAILEEMIKAGVFYGRKKSKTNPVMKQYISTSRNSVEIIDLSEAIKLLDNVKRFLEELFKAKPTAKVLIVGTLPSAEEAVKSLSQKFNFPYVITRWIGGTLSNFKIIHARIEYFKTLKLKKNSGGLEKYTKKERLMIDREIDRMDRIFSGIETMSQQPEVLLVFNAKAHDIAIREARIMKIPIIAVLSTDTNPKGIDFIIPANDNIKSSINWIASYLEKSFVV
jgi:small subunit ribosomal protein S2